MKLMTPSTLKFATVGSISHGTLRTEDLLSAFIHELDWQLLRNGEYFSRPENHDHRDRLNKLVGEGQDCFAEDGETIPEENEDTAAELVNETFPNALQEFCAPYFYFGTHSGDGSDFGFWPDIDAAKENCEFVSFKGAEYPDDEFTGEWLHINERGNCTLYVRGEDGTDTEIWGVV